jgi:ABC-2 type transport system ATP-binding protein
MTFPAAPILHLQNLRKTFGDFTAIHDVSFDVPAGSITALIGANGAGKTTLLKIITRLIPADSGLIESSFESPASRTGRTPASWLSYVPEEFGLYERMRVEEVIIYFARLGDLSLAQARQNLTPWLERFKLTPKRRERLVALSKGNQQKVKLICALIHQPPLLILDEPFTGLDGEGSALLRQCLLEARAAGTTILCSSHRLDQMDLLADHLVVIDAGRVVLDATLAEARRLYRQNLIEVTFGDVTPTLERLPGVLETTWDEGVAALTLAPEANPTTILKTILERGGEIESFTRHAPGLDEIFKTLTK